MRRPRAGAAIRAEAHALAGGSRAAQRLRDQIRQIAPTRATVLLEGEHGVGKSLVARALHAASPRRDRPFVHVDAVAAAPALELELFGGGDGAAAGPGAFTRADGGTLLLDAIDELPPSLQTLLLGVLQERTLMRAGLATPGRVDVRLVASTRRDLGAEVAAGRFRADLFWSLSVVHIVLPPLRERREDIPELVQALLADLVREHRRRPRTLTRGALERLVAYDWPGNISELKSLLEGMVVSARGAGPLDVSSLPARVRENSRDEPGLRVEVGMTLEEAARVLIAATLRRVEGDKPRAAAMLGIGLRTLYRKLERPRRR